MNRPVIVLAKKAEKDMQIQKNDGMVTILHYPIQLENLRNTVTQYLK